MLLILIYFPVTNSNKCTGAPQPITTENYQKQNQKKRHTFLSFAANHRGGGEVEWKSIVGARL